MNNQEITLTWPEVNLAAYTGIMRHILSLKDRRIDQHGADKEKGWQLHIEGASGEVAVAKFLGVYFEPTVNTFKSPDLECNIQVRTRSSHDYELIVRDDDSDNDIFILVTGSSPHYVIRGWMKGKDAKNQTWKHSHGGREPAFFVPQSEMNDISLLCPRR